MTLTPHLDLTFLYSAFCGPLGLSSTSLLCTFTWPLNMMAGLLIFPSLSRIEPLLSIYWTPLNSVNISAINHLVLAPADFICHMISEIKAQKPVSTKETQFITLHISKWQTSFEKHSFLCKPWAVKQIRALLRFPSHISVFPTWGSFLSLCDRWFDFA